MKKQLFLLAVTAAALTGCNSSGLKKYKTEVKLEEFQAKFEELSKENEILQFTKESNYSFEMTIESEETEGRKFYKDDKVHHESFEKTVSSEVIKYDSENSRMKYETKLEVKAESDEYKTKGSEHISKVFQLKDEDAICVNLSTKTIESKEEDGKDYIVRKAMSYVEDLISDFKNVAQYEISEESKLYIDGDVYTVVNSEEDETEDNSDIFQIQVYENKIVFHAEYDYVQKRQKRDRRVADQEDYLHTSYTVTLEKKDVKVKEVNTSKYFDKTIEK